MAYEDRLYWNDRRFVRHDTKLFYRYAVKTGKLKDGDVFSVGKLFAHKSLQVEYRRWRERKARGGAYMQELVDTPENVIAHYIETVSRAYFDKEIGKVNRLAAYNGYLPRCGSIKYAGQLFFPNMDFSDALKCVQRGDRYVVIVGNKPRIMSENKYRLYKRLGKLCEELAEEIEGKA